MIYICLPNAVVLNSVLRNWHPCVCVLLFTVAHSAWLLSPCQLLLSDMKHTFSCVGTSKIPCVKTVIINGNVCAYQIVIFKIITLNSLGEFSNIRDYEKHEVHVEDIVALFSSFCFYVLLFLSFKLMTDWQTFSGRCVFVCVWGCCLVHTCRKQDVTHM